MNVRKLQRRSVRYKNYIIGYISYINVLVSIKLYEYGIKKLVNDVYPLKNVKNLCSQLSWNKQD